MQANLVDVICLFERVFKLTWDWVSYIWKVKLWIEDKKVVKKIRCEKEKSIQGFANNIMMREDPEDKPE